MTKRAIMIEIACRSALNKQEMRSVLSCATPELCVSCKTRVRACIEELREIKRESRLRRREPMSRPHARDCPGWMQ